MTGALYGERGFYRRGGGPSAHFRTSAHAGPGFADAFLELVGRVDAALGGPATFDLIDVGAGRGELLADVLGRADRSLVDRLRPVAVELADRPASLDPRIGWQSTIPDAVVGLLLATEWLDNVPIDIAVRDGGRWRYRLVDAAGTEAVDGLLSPADAAWRRQWWPVGDRAEIGRPRDEAWADAVGSVMRGLATTVDYGHRRDARPAFGTLTGYRDGREVRPVPDGTCDLTAHVATDAVAAAGANVAGQPPWVATQAEALRRLGVAGRRPPLAQAHDDPAGYLRALAAASAAAELTDPAGLGGHLWLVQPVAIDLAMLKLAG
jgi:SAM-dependent MidA family methyltransferase